MLFQIIRNDITAVKADAIVNTANPKPRIGLGTDGAIYSAAGKEQLLDARRAIGNIERGQAAATKAFKLNAKYIIHTVGPKWIDKKHDEYATLHSCYANSLALAAKLKCKSIAFPLISSGEYGFPKDEALNIALSEIGKFLLMNDMKVILVVFDKESFQLSKQLAGSIEEYIDDHSANLLFESEYKRDYEKSGRNKKECCKTLTADKKDTAENTGEDVLSLSGAFAGMEGKSLDELLDDTGDTFQQRLFKLIDASGMDDVAVYKKANVDRKAFSRIRCKAGYKPKKKTAVAFAIALELDLPSTIDLLARAEIAFSPSSKFDLIVAYFITNKNYDIFEINAALFKYGQPILGE